LDEGKAERPDLQRLVETAARLRDAVTSEPSAAADARTLAAARSAFAAAPAGRRPTRVRPRRRVTLIAAILVALIPTSSLAAWPAASRSLPGEPLYGLKLTQERARLLIAVGPRSEAAVFLEIAQRRIEEAVAAAARDLSEAETEALRRYGETVRAFDLEIAASRARGIDVTDLEAIARAMFERHALVLGSLLDIAPAAAVPGLTRAYAAALEHRSGTPGDDPAGAPSAGASQGGGQNPQEQDDADPPNAVPAPPPAEGDDPDSLIPDTRPEDDAEATEDTERPPWAR
jgi:hypothetical protein